MKTSLKKFIFICATLLSYGQAAQAYAQDMVLQKRIDQLLKQSGQAGQTSNIGIMVTSLQNGKILYQRNADTVFNTASAMKVFTAVAALDFLKPDYHFSTILATDKLIRSAGTTQNLYLKFSGDPTLKSSDLANLTNTLTLNGIHHITGNLIIDDTVLHNSNWGPGWMWDERAICYAAPATAIVVDKNCFSATLTPGKTAGSVSTLHIMPNLTGAVIKNITQTHTSAKWQCPLELQTLNHNRYLLSGCIAPNQPALPLEIALDDPTLAIKTVLSAALQQQGITLDGAMMTGKMPATATTLAQHTSPALSEIIKEMLKKSDNLMADIIFKTLGAHYFKSTGTWQNGAAALQFILAPQMPFNFKDTVIVDGAGLSRYNLLSARQFSALLTYAYKKMPAHAIFYTALPIMGVDGTLEERLKNTPYAGKIHAKTGTMSSTSTLVGYVETQQQGTLAFAILINGFVLKPEAFQALEDKIAMALVQA